ncbi:nucleotidyltransferase family protein [Nocardia lijiangensis]|uniref:nucleotidyltransferase family protein n=1 Tax=Nocardia lijiangensis TaxID=299618 RepID=UPI00082E60C6|nr:nucleotidyltransferase family protein [Nocardia lijiangensis]
MVATMDELLHALTRAANTLHEAEIRFAVAGGCAVYARGGPATDHDVDIFVKPADISQAIQVLAKSGLRVCEPPEDWLSKVYDGDTLVDVIYRPNCRDVTDELLDRATVMRVGPTVAPVISATDLMIDKLLVFDAHRLDLSPLLHIARDLREQVDWAVVRSQTKESPYARAFLGLVDDLGITDAGWTAAGQQHRGEG